VASQARRPASQAVALPVVLLLAVAGLLAVLPMLRPLPESETGSPAGAEIHSEQDVIPSPEDGPVETNG
jgi:hypothetical protein